MEIGARLRRASWTVLICAQVAVAVGVLPAVVAIAWNYTPPPTPTFPASEILGLELRSPSGSGDAVASGEPGPDYATLQAELLRRVEEPPEVSGVTFTSAGNPAFAPTVRVEVEDPTDAGEKSVSASRSHGVDVEYLGVFGGSLLAGRTFDRSDAVDGATAVLVNRAFADEHFGGGGALGRRFREVTGADGEDEGGPWFEVVGVVENMPVPREAGRLRRTCFIRSGWGLATNGSARHVSARPVAAAAFNPLLAPQRVCSDALQGAASTRNSQRGFHWRASSSASWSRAA